MDSASTTPSLAKRSQVRPGLRRLLLLLAILAVGAAPRVAGAHPHHEHGQSHEPAKLRVDSQPPGELFVDGRSQGVTPVELSLHPGPHAVEIRVPGHKPYRRVVDTHEGMTVELRATLEVKTRRVVPSARVGASIPIRGEGAEPGPSVGLDTVVLPWTGDHGFGLTADATFSVHGVAGRLVPNAAFRLPWPAAEHWESRAEMGVGPVWSRIRGEPAFTDHHNGSFWGISIAGSVRVAHEVLDGVFISATPLGIDWMPPWLDLPHGVVSYRFDVGVGTQVGW